MTLTIENNGIKEVPQSFTYKINYRGNKNSPFKHHMQLTDRISSTGSGIMGTVGSSTKYSGNNINNHDLSRFLHGA